MSPSDVTALSPRRHIVQCARAIGPGYGVSGPAYQLERAFIGLGCACERFTLEHLGIRTTAPPPSRPVVALVRFWRDIVLFSVAGSLVLWWKFGGRRRDPRTIVLCHVDALFGDIFVVRSLHKAFLEHHPFRTRMLLRNPLHALVLARDRIRFRWGIHRHLVALSQGNKDELVRLYNVPSEKISVIPNGVDLDRFQPSGVHRQNVRLELALPDDGVVAIFVGHEFERKGLRVVLEALRLLNERGVTMRLIVAGGDSPDRLQREFSDLADRVRFVGLRQDIERHYAAADLFVLPASFDISPLAGLEALASGLPILMPDLGGVREYLRDGENGWFITREPEDVAAKLARLASDGGLLRRVSARARESVADRDWPMIARRYLDLIDRLFPLPESG
jgi:UDP-glucose:(heptosyl)LPS alpha-1,3-glucosyltransferase